MRVSGSHSVDRDQASVATLVAEGASGAASLDDALAQLESPRILWVMLPAGGPTEETVAALRSAFDETMADRQYRADAQRVGLGISPLSGSDMHNLMNTVSDIPEDLVVRLRTLILAQTQK